ncbi:hypothetical protein EDD29_5614 [Actinocorallia herbida]|uniref:Uncharacterized protein n=1 Tax=Actinocorallia herbida TaxID=58109 RepID=A0A3N1D366_9ACTN|nr:hypothetical protein [Actinocorallia herbida]ROO87965.1 hypothetical protein EDD29_5614 [Actinocorallia herbida]
MRTCPSRLTIGQEVLPPWMGVGGGNIQERSDLYLYYREYLQPKTPAGRA